MFNLEEYVKKTLVDLYDKKVYIGAKVRELALNYLVKGLISQETVEWVDEYICNKEETQYNWLLEETPVESEAIREESEVEE